MIWLGAFLRRKLMSLSLSTRASFYFFICRGLSLDAWLAIRSMAIRTVSLLRMLVPKLEKTASMLSGRIPVTLSFFLRLNSPIILSSLHIRFCNDWGRRRQWWEPLLHRYAWTCFRAYLVGYFHWYQSWLECWLGSTSIVDYCHR